MEYQPDEIPQCTYNEEFFNQLDTILSLDQFQCSDSSSRNDFDTQVLLCEQAQCSNISSRNDLDMYLPPSLRSPDDLLDNEDASSHSPNGQATASVIPNNDVDEELFRNQDSGVIHYVPEPDNEVTIPTTSSDVDIRNTETVGDISSELNLDDLETLTPDQMDNFMEEIMQLQIKPSLYSVDELIVERIMGIKTHPPANLRLRYKTDGPRQVAKSLTNPTVIDIPNLKNIQLNSDQTFLIRLLLATWTENPSDGVYLHPNISEYHSDDAIELTDGSICVPLAVDDIKKGIKAFPRLQIIKRKLGTYKRELTPLNLSGIASDINGNDIVTVNEAKKIFDQYNLKASRIICQLLIKENELFRFTDIVCATHKMEETQQPNKRPKESTEDDEEEEIDARPSRSKSTKRKKNSH
ncbi:unnamed protein product [Adineta steineri]|uniref:Uncharacterized protein n=1 Tax=Adineta steineri TaxID=433720 RepID=A0A818Y1V8_9BILA|nr:unnamed protein product [Adineta steineri]CAF3747589.1 unnamed protein product [Adineta steineri]